MKIQLALDKKQSDPETLVFYIKNLNPRIINLIKFKSEDIILDDDILFVKIYIMKGVIAHYDVFIDVNENLDLIPIALGVNFNQISSSIKQFFKTLN